jgi:hypothetical protein
MVFGQNSRSGSYRSYIGNLNLSLYDNVIVTVFFFKKHVICLELVDLCYVLHLFSLVSCGLYIYIHKLYVYKEEFSLNCSRLQLGLDIVKWVMSQSEMGLPYVECGVCFSMYPLYYHTS